MEECLGKTPLEWIRLLGQVTISLLIISGNSLVIVSIVVVKGLRHPRNLLLLSLAVADLLVGLFLVPFRIDVIENCYLWKFGKVLCYMWIDGETLLCTVISLNLTAISIDRYFAIEKPLFHRVHFSRGKILILIALAWILSFLINVPYWALASVHHEIVIGNTTVPVCINDEEAWHQLCGVLGVFFLPLAILIFVYGSIARVLKRQQVKLNIKGNHNILTQQNDVTETDPTRMCPVCKFVHDRKGFVMTGIIVACFVACFLPFFSLLLVDAIFKIMEKDFKLPLWILETLLWINYVHSCLNPFIYTMFNKDFRFAFKELLSFRCLTINSRLRSDLYSKQTATSTPTVSNASINSTSTLANRHFISNFRNGREEEFVTSKL